MTQPQLPEGVRPATADDADEMARILSAAFLPDPVWGPLFPEPDPARREAQTRTYWRFMVDEALRHPDSLVLEGEAGGLRAISVWLPPGADEVAEDAHDAYETMVVDLLGPEAAPAMFRSGEQFGAARPTDPHAYLTLLAVAPGARGGGYGMSLLRAGLERYDAAGIPTYLESSNPANDARYERLGYAPYAVVRLDDGGSAQTYWRDPA